VDSTIKYLGVNFHDEITLDQKNLMLKFQKSLNIIASTSMLQPDQKLQILNEFIWPTLVNPLQSATLSKLPKKLLMDLDILMKSCTKGILQLPPDTPNAMLYASKKHKGLGLKTNPKLKSNNQWGKCRCNTNTKNKNKKR